MFIVWYMLRQWLYRFCYSCNILGKWVLGENGTIRLTMNLRPPTSGSSFASQKSIGKLLNKEEHDETHRIAHPLDLPVHLRVQPLFRLGQPLQSGTLSLKHPETAARNPATSWSGWVDRMDLLRGWRAISILPGVAWGCARSFNCGFPGWHRHEISLNHLIIRPDISKAQGWYTFTERKKLN